MATFNHFELKLLNPSFDSPLVDIITELELLRHLRLEIKVDQLTSLQFLSQKILFPAIAFALEKNALSDVEAKILRKAVTAGIIKAGDLKEVLPKLKPAQITYQISKLVEQKLLEPTSDKARSYAINISHSSLMRGVIQSLKNEGFVPRAC